MSIITKAGKDGVLAAYQNIFLVFADTRTQNIHSHRLEVKMVKDFCV